MSSTETTLERGELYNDTETGIWTSEYSGLDFMTVIDLSENSETGNEPCSGRKEITAGDEKNEACVYIMSSSSGIVCTI